ncbi:MAG TPA: RDD family protein [Arachnia sp.]|jgi:uncharacterized RDD family membrane protein YckC|nr:RDD family protein [Arachnia sp.]
MTAPLLARDTPGSRPDRIKARLVTGLIGIATYAVAVVVVLGADGAGPATVVALLVVMTVAVWALWLMLARGQTPGYKVLGLVVTDPATGMPAGGKLFIRNLLQAVVSLLSCGIAEPIISYVSFDGRSTWFDRTVGVHVVEVAGRPARDPEAHTPATPALAAAVTAVSLDHDDALSDPTHLVENDPPQAQTGWQPVSSGHAPIQSIPSHTSEGEPRRPQTPVVLPPVLPSSASVPRQSAVPRPVGGEAPPAGGEGMITGVPWPRSVRGSSASQGHDEEPVHDPAAGVTPTAAPSTPPPPAHAADAAPSGSDHTVVDEDVLDAAGLTPVLVLDDGEQHPIGAPLVLGRAPVPPAEHPDAEVVAIADPTMKVSKTHALVTYDGASVLVTDLGSTNGLRIVVGTEPSRRLAPRVPHVLRTGERILIGGRSFEVAR